MATPAHKAARLAGTLVFLQTGSGQAGFRIYDGTQPTLETDAPPGGNVLLTTLYLDNVIGTIVSGELNLSASNVALIVATGTPSWARYFNRAGVDGGDVTVSGPGGGGQLEIEVDTLTGQIYIGGMTALLSGTFT